MYTSILRKKLALNPGDQELLEALNRKSLKSQKGPTSNRIGFKRPSKGSQYDNPRLTLNGNINKDEDVRRGGRLYQSMDFSGEMDKIYK